MLNHLNKKKRSKFQFANSLYVRVDPLSQLLGHSVCNNYRDKDACKCIISTTIKMQEHPRIPKNMLNTCLGSKLD